MGNVDNKDVDGQIRGFRSGVEDGTVTGSLETVRDEDSDSLSLGSGGETEGGETRDSGGKEEGGDVVHRRDADEPLPPPSPPSQPRANIVKILRFFDIVKHHYAERPSVYATFMEVIKDFGMRMNREDERNERVAQLFADAPLLDFQFGLLLSSPDARSGRLDRSLPVAIYKAPSALPDSRRLQLVVLQSNRPLAARSSLARFLGEVRNPPLGKYSFALLK